MKKLKFYLFGKKGSISTKILLPVIIVLILTLSSTFLVTMNSFENLIEENFVTRLNQLGSVAQEDIITMREGTAFQVRALAFAGKFTKLYETNDMKAMEKYIDEFEAPDKNDYFIVTNKKGKIIYNTIDNKYNGKSIADLDVFKNAIAGDLTNNIGKVLDMPLCLYASAPIHHGGLETGAIVGAVITGYDLAKETHVDRYKNQYGIEATFFNGDMRIATTVMNEKGQRAVGTAAKPEVAKAVLEEGKEFHSQVDLFGKKYFVKYIPLSNSEGKNVAMFFAGITREEADKKIAIIGRIIVAITVATLVIVGALLFSVVSSIVRRIKIIARNADAIAHGDITVTTEMNGNDEVGELGEAFRIMTEAIGQEVDIVSKVSEGDLTVEVQARGEKDSMGQALEKTVTNLNQMFMDMNSSAENVNEGVRQVANGSQLLAQGATEQAATVIELSQSIEGITVKTKENGKIAEEAAKLAEGIKENASKGTVQMGEMVKAVQEITEASNSINKVIKVIDDIAFQTNILALNAAVEAARAGQSGKGFAVVAEEVRNLAAKSAMAANETGELIQNSIEKAQIGAEIAEETAKSLEDIVKGVNESSKIVSTIAQSSQRQIIDISDINYGIEQVGKVIQQNSATSEELAASSEEISSQAQMLKSLIAKFKIKNNRYNIKGFIGKY